VLTRETSSRDGNRTIRAPSNFGDGSQKVLGWILVEDNGGWGLFDLDESQTSGEREVGRLILLYCQPVRRLRRQRIRG